MKKFQPLLAVLFCLPIAGFAQSYEWGGAFGGIGEDVVRAMSVDDEGNSYITGYFTDSSDMDPTENTVEVTSNGWFDVFVQKIDSDGNLVWIKTFGGDWFEYGTGIETDADGNVYVCGVYEETVDFDPGEGVFELTSSGAQDVFALKLDMNGDFQWARSMGGTGYEEPVSIGTDGSGNVYLAGYLSQPGDYDPGEEVVTLTSNGSQDAFIVKLDPNGIHLWSGNMGGPDLDLCLGMDVDTNGDVYIAGSVSGTGDFDISEGVAEYASLGDFDAYVTKLNPLGEHVYTAGIGGTGADIAWDVAIDGNGNAYAAGGFRGEFETGIPEPVQSGPGVENVFVSKINPFGSLEWSALMTGDQFANAYDVNTDPSGNVILSGYFSDEIDFDPSESEVILTKESSEPFDAFVVALNGEGSYLYAGNFGGSDFVEHHGVDTDADGNIYLSAAFQNTIDLDPSPEMEDQASVIAFRDSYIIKLSALTAVSTKNEIPALQAVYPNPAREFITVEGISGASYGLFDITGKQVKSGIMQTSRIAIDDLPNGVYLLNVNGYRPVKVVKR